MSGRSVPGSVVDTGRVEMATSIRAVILDGSKCVDMESVETFSQVLYVSLDIQVTNGDFFSLASPDIAFLRRIALAHPGGCGLCLLELDITSSSVSSRGILDMADSISGLILSDLSAELGTPVFLVESVDYDKDH